MAHRLGVHSSCASGVHGLHENAARERDAVPGSLLRSGGPTPVLDLTNYYILTQKLPKTAASSRSTPAPDPRPFLAPLRGSPAQYRLPAVPTVVGPVVPTRCLPRTCRGRRRAGHPRPMAQTMATALARSPARSGAIWRDLSPISARGAQPLPQHAVIEAAVALGGG